MKVQQALAINRAAITKTVRQSKDLTDCTRTENSFITAITGAVQAR